MITKHYDILLVGSGLHNAVFARLATDAGLKCLIVDKREHLGGNVRDTKVDHINVHQYGAHIFHTSDDTVWNFVNKYAKFNNYVNSPIANYKGEIYNLPFNMNTFSRLWDDVRTPQQAQARINEQILKIDNPSNLEEQALSMVGYEIYNTLIKGYTEKQWGMSCSELPPDIIKRIPLRFTYDNNYFNDKYQGIPVRGYTSLLMDLMSGSDLYPNREFSVEDSELMGCSDTIVYSGRIDEFFKFCYGELEYRSLRFEHLKVDIKDYQGNAVVNYTGNECPYTRIIEHKHFDVWNPIVKVLPYTIITKEYPVLMMDKNQEPYYPINNEENNNLCEKYKELTNQYPNVIFGGRLAEYKYYDMDKVILSAMKHFEEYMQRKGEK